VTNQEENMKVTFNNRLSMCVLALGVTAVTAPAVTITLDPATQYQTIVGFGGEAIGASSYASDIVNDAGVSVLRLDWCGAVHGLLDSRPFWNAGCHTLIGSCWSPPANMKDNGSLNNGGHLLAAQYNAFGDFAVAQLNAFRTAYGGEMYALSPQNEPAFAEFYGSCIYDGADLINVMKVIGQKIQQAGLHTKIFLPEDVYDQWTLDGKYWAPLLQDATAKSYVSAIAFHGYTSNGVTPAQMSASTLGRMYAMAHTNGWELWQTENAGSKNLNYAYDVIACLRYGKVSMYLKYDITADGGGSDEYYIAGSTKNLTYYVAKCINKFIRPGAVQIRSTSPDSASFSNFVAFYDRTASALAITMATDANAQSINLKGVNLPANLQKWVASASVNCVNQGDVASNSTISLPANSVITLYGTGYTPPVSGVSMPLARSAGAQALTGNRRAYDLSGRQMNRQTMRSDAGRVAVMVGDGRTQSRLLVVR
jgi:O-glycosyl hydrolase